MRSPEDDEMAERVLRLLVRAVEDGGENPKPVILHSMRVGMALYERGHETPVVVAGFLHDVLEDTAVTAPELRSRFGERVTEVVAPTSFDPEIEDSLERHRDIYERDFEVGRAPVLVKAADLLDNSDYYRLGDSPELARNQVRKLEYFLANAEPYIGEEPLYADLEDSLPVVRDRVAERLED